LYWSPRLAIGVIIVNNWLCLSVWMCGCLSVTNFNLLLLFGFSMESSHFLAVSSPWPLYKTLFFDFWFRPLTPKIYSRKNLHKIAYKSACMADRPDVFGPTRGFSGTADSMEPCKMLWADPFAMATKFGLGAEIQSPTGLLIIIVNSLRNRHSENKYNNA